MTWNPITLSESSYGRAGIVPGSFVTAGTGVKPTVWDGAIRDVQILTTGAVEFYRVTLADYYRGVDGVHVAFASARPLTATDDLTVMVGEYVAAPALAFTDRQFDVVIRNSGAVDVTTGRKVDLLIIGKQD